MIHFALRCEPKGHDFDAWFRSGADFERQTALSLVACPVCGSGAVAKALMTPSVSAKRAFSAVPEEASKAMAALRDLARSARASADYVGERFAEEARRIHYGEVEQRQIYGEASPPEVKGLVEEGISILPLPPLPEDKN